MDWTWKNTGFATIWRTVLLCLFLAVTGCMYRGYPQYVIEERQQVPVAPLSVSRSQPEIVPVRFDANQNKEPVPPSVPKPASPSGKEGLPAPVTGSGPALTLDQAINTTLLADPKIRAGLENINQAGADLLTSSLRPNPDLTVGATLLPLNRQFTINQQGGPPQPGADLSYPIDWYLFGKRFAAMASSAAQVRVTEADYGDLVRQRVTQAATTFYDVLQTKALFDLARQDVESLRRVEAATRKAVDAGGRPVVELNRVRLDVLKSEQDLRDAETALVEAKANLRGLLGRRDADPAFDVSGSLEAALTAQPVTVEEALVLAEQNRPDIRSLRLQIDKAARDVHSERAKAYPSITPKVGYLRQIQQKTNGFPDTNLYEFSVDVTLPVSDRNQGNIAKARSVYAQNAFNMEAGLVDLRTEIVGVVQEFRTAYQNAGSVAEEQVRLAREVRDAVEKSFKEGGRSLLEVLDAEKNYRDTYRTYITNRANYWRAAYKYSSAIGQQIITNDKHP